MQGAAVAGARVSTPVNSPRMTLPVTVPASTYCSLLADMSPHDVSCSYYRRAWHVQSLYWVFFAPVPLDKPRFVQRDCCSRLLPDRRCCKPHCPPWVLKSCSVRVLPLVTWKSWCNVSRKEIKESQSPHSIARATVWCHAHTALLNQSSCFCGKECGRQQRANRVLSNAWGCPHLIDPTAAPDVLSRLW